MLYGSWGLGVDFNLFEVINRRIHVSYLNGGVWVSVLLTLHVATF